MKLLEIRLRFECHSISYEISILQICFYREKRSHLWQTDNLWYVNNKTTHTWLKNFPSGYGAYFIPVCYFIVNAKTVIPMVTHGCVIERPHLHFNGIINKGFYEDHYGYILIFIEIDLLYMLMLNTTCKALPQIPCKQNEQRSHKVINRLNLLTCEFP